MGPHTIALNMSWRRILEFLGTKVSKNLLLPSSGQTTSHFKYKGIVRPRTGHESPEGKYRYWSTLSFTSAPDGGGWSTPHRDRLIPIVPKAGYDASKPKKMVAAGHSTAPSGPRTPHNWDFHIKLRHTTLCRTPLYEWLAYRRDLYLTTHNTHNRQTSMPPVGFEPAIPAGEQPYRLIQRGQWDRLGYYELWEWDLTFRRLMSTIVDVPHR